MHTSDVPQNPTYDEVLSALRDAKERLQDVRKMCHEIRSDGMSNMATVMATLDRIEARAFYGKQFMALKKAERAG